MLNDEVFAQVFGWVKRESRYTINWKQRRYDSVFALMVRWQHLGIDKTWFRALPLDFL